LVPSAWTAFYDWHFPP